MTKNIPCQNSHNHQISSWAWENLPVPLLQKTNPLLTGHSFAFLAALMSPATASASWEINSQSRRQDHLFSGWIVILEVVYVQNSKLLLQCNKSQFIWQLQVHKDRVRTENSQIQHTMPHLLTSNRQNQRQKDLWESLKTSNSCGLIAPGSLCFLNSFQAISLFSVSGFFPSVLFLIRAILARLKYFIPFSVEFHAEINLCQGIWVWMVGWYQ